jgi:hypothetical protein
MTRKEGTEKNKDIFSISTGTGSNPLVSSHFTRRFSAPDQHLVVPLLVSKVHTASDTATPYFVV